MVVAAVGQTMQDAAAAEERHEGYPRHAAYASGEQATAGAAVLLAGGLARVKDMNAECLQQGTETATSLARALDDAIHSMT